MPRRFLGALTALLMVLFTASPALAASSNQGDSAAAWPSSWNDYRHADGTQIRDVNDDENPSGSDISSGPCAGCTGPSGSVLYASDGTTAFFRLRLATDPADASKGGLTGDAYLVQLAVGPSDTVVAVVGVNGKSASTDYVYTVTGANTSETRIYSYPFDSLGGQSSAGMRVVPDGNGQFFLDWQVPFARLQAAALAGGAGTFTTSTPVKIYYGSSAAANLAVINKDFMAGVVGQNADFSNLEQVTFAPTSAAVSAAASYVSGPNPPAASTPAATTRYTVALTAQNPGGGDLTSGVVTATLPPGISWVSGSTATGSVSHTGSTVTWNVGTLGPLASATATLTLDLTPTQPMVGATTPLLSVIAMSGTDVPFAATRTATAADVVVGPVVQGNRAPVAVADPAVVNEDGSVTVSVLANDSDPDGNALSASVTAGPSHGTATVNTGGTTLQYTPTPGYSGPDSFTYAACDPSGACTTAIVSVTVNHVNHAPVAADFAGAVNQDTSVVLNVPLHRSDSDGDALTTTITTEALHGTTVVRLDGTVLYTPNAGYVGADSFVYQVCDPLAACASGTVTMTVAAVNHAPTATGFSGAVDEDTNVALNVSAHSSDPDHDTLTTTVTTDALHGTTVVESDGSVTYTPDADYNGADSFVYRVCDPSNACASGTIALTVAPVNDPPAAGDFAGAVDEDASVVMNVPLHSTDVDGDALTTTIMTDALHGTTVVGFAGAVRYTPNPDYNGTDSFVYLVCDPSAACASGKVTVTVRAVNDAPSAESFAGGVDEDGSVVLDVPFNSSDPDGDALVTTVTTGPQHGTAVVETDGSVTYTPVADDNGPDSLVYQVCDPSGLCASGTVTLTVASVNDGPLATSFTGDVDEDGSVVLDVPFNTSDPDDDTLTTTVTTGPKHGTTVVEFDGSVLYTPVAGYNGPDSLVYQVCDPSGLCASGTVTVAVGAVNDRPLAAGFTGGVDEDGSVVLDVPFNSSDPDGDTLTTTVTTDPQYGTAVVESDGSATYTPDADYDGADSFVYQVCDPSGLCASGTVTLTVAPVNDTPIATDFTGYVDQDASAVLDVPAHSSDPDGDPLTTTVTTPLHGTAVVEVDGSVTYTPSAGYAGLDSFGYTVCDQSPIVGAASMCASGTVRMTAVRAAELNQAPTASNFDGKVGADGSVTLNVAAHSADADGDVLITSITAGPRHGVAVVQADGSIKYTPDANWSGTDTFTYSVCDPTGACDTGTITLTVDGVTTIVPVHRTPTAAATAAAANDPSPVALSDTGARVTAELALALALLLVGGIMRVAVRRRRG